MNNLEANSLQLNIQVSDKMNNQLSRED